MDGISKKGGVTQLHLKSDAPLHLELSESHNNQTLQCKKITAMIGSIGFMSRRATVMNGPGPIKSGHFQFRLVFSIL